MPGIDIVLTELPALAGSAQAAARDAFAREVRRLEPGVTTLAWRLLGWSAQAIEVEDVVQEVFLAAWTHRARLRDPAAFGGWLRTITVRQVRNHVRSRTRRARLTALRGFGPGAEPCGETPAGDDGRLRDALQSLRHADREVLVLRYLEGYAPTEIADALGLRRTAVDARLSRARRRLGALLESEEDR